MTDCLLEADRRVLVICAIGCGGLHSLVQYVLEVMVNSSVSYLSWGRVSDTLIFGLVP